MPITKSAKKALRQEKRRTVVNYKIRAAVRANLKTARLMKEPEQVSQAFAALDKAAKKHIMHKNKAARLKSRLAKLVATPEVKPVAPVKTAKKPAAAKKAVKKAAKSK